MYRAKAIGPGVIEVFDEEMRAELAARLQVEGELREAVEADQLRRLLPADRLARRLSGGLRGARALAAPQPRAGVAQGTSSRSPRSTG